MRQTLLLLTCLAALSGGCMSIANHSPYFCPDETQRERPYGGVRGDAEAIAESVLTVARGQVETPRDLAGRTLGTTLFVIDLPLSAVADTIWLSHDIRATREKRDRARAERTQHSRVATEADPHEEDR